MELQLIAKRCEIVSSNIQYPCENETNGEITRLAVSAKLFAQKNVPHRAANI
jgi:hypothetical protein